MIPQDPVMLLSFINLKLRDYYGSLEQLCDDLDVKEQEIRDKLASIDYHYNEERNRGCCWSRWRRGGDLKSCSLTCSFICVFPA